MRYTYLLRRYLETKYGCNSISKEVYDRLMECLKEMRELNVDIVNFFRGYHRLIGGSPLFTQILELPPTAECLERQNELLSTLSSDSSLMSSASSSGYSTSTQFEFNDNSYSQLNHHHHHHLLHQQNSNHFGSDNVAICGTADMNVQKNTNSNITQPNASTSVSAANSAPTTAQQNCFGILNSVN